MMGLGPEGTPDLSMSASTSAEGFGPVIMGTPDNGDREAGTWYGVQV